MKLNNMFNYEKTKGKKITMPSQTVPDQTMSIRTILERYAKGLPTTGYKVPIYEDADIDNPIQDPRTMDLAERQIQAKQFKAELEQIERKRTRTKDEDNKANGEQ